MSEALVVLVTGSTMRVYAKAGEEATEIAKLRIPDDVDEGRLLSFALHFADIMGTGFGGANGDGPKPERRRAASPPGTSSKDVFEWLAEHGPATAPEIRQALGLDVKMTSNRLTSLRGKVHSLGDGRYAVINGAEPPRAHRRPRAGVSTLDLLAWLREHGPATRQEMAAAFPALSKTHLGNRVTALVSAHGVSFDHDSKCWRLPEA